MGLAPWGRERHLFANGRSSRRHESRSFKTNDGALQRLLLSTIPDNLQLFGPLRWLAGRLRARLARAPRGKVVNDD
jgi:hypothetical protein